ncbi:MAG TPA: hypothetical protein VNY27_06745 [Solirubrobacteraceae bacterium]|nr:hypothetical protein [Solirubrobacteraceae bacterium]
MRKTEKAKPEDEPAPGENPPTGAGAGGEEGVGGGGGGEPRPTMVIATFGVVSRPATAPTIPPGAIAKEAAGDAAGIEAARETPPEGGVPAVAVGPIDRSFVAGADADAELECTDPLPLDPLPPLPPGW